MPRPRLRPFIALAALALVLSGCSTTVALEPGRDANNPACAEVTAYLPSSIAGQDRRWTDAQSTGAWGDPTTILMTCGVTPPGPSTLPCQSAGGVDWLIDDSEAPNYRLTSFGRNPAVEVYLDYDVVSSADVLDALGRLVSKLPKTGECTERPGTE